MRHLLADLSIAAAVSVLVYTLTVWLVPIVTGVGL